jgi:hypothetical protein
VPFCTHKDFFLNPLVSLVLPSCAKGQAVAMVTIDSLDPSFENLNIDLDVLAYIDDLASNT